MIEFEVCPPAAGNMVCHLVMRGSRTVEELAGLCGINEREARRTVKWLKAHNFIESSRLKAPGKNGGPQDQLTVFSIRVASSKGLLV